MAENHSGSGPGRNLGDEIAGRAKQAWGKLTNDEQLEAEGRAQHMADDLREDVSRQAPDPARTDPPGSGAGSDSGAPNVDPLAQQAEEPSWRAEPVPEQPGGSGGGSGIVGGEPGEDRPDPLDRPENPLDRPLDPDVTEPSGTDLLWDEVDITEPEPRRAANPPEDPPTMAVPHGG